MIEQVAREQRRELLARAARPHTRRPLTWRSLATYIGIRRGNLGRAGAATTPSLAPLPGGASGRRPIAAGQPGELATGAPLTAGKGGQASAA
jgi:hypothetical protein